MKLQIRLQTLFLLIALPLLNIPCGSVDLQSHFIGDNLPIMRGDEQRECRSDLSGSAVQLESELRCPDEGGRIVLSRLRGL